MTPEAARFAAQQAAQAAPGARGAKRTVERLIHGPLGALVLTGKLTRHTSWVAVYDEGGIYLLPEGYPSACFGRQPRGSRSPLVSKKAPKQTVSPLWSRVP